MSFDRINAIICDKYIDRVMLYLIPTGRNERTENASENVNCNTIYCCAEEAKCSYLFSMIQRSNLS